MRKALLFIFVVASLLRVTCSKDLGKTSLFGRWKLVQISYFSQTMTFQDYRGDPAYIQFNTDGTVTGDAPRACSNSGRTTKLFVVVFQ